MAKQMYAIWYENFKQVIFKDFLKNSIQIPKLEATNIQIFEKLVTMHILPFYSCVLSLCDTNCVLHQIINMFEKYFLWIVE